MSDSFLFPAPSTRDMQPPPEIAPEWAAVLQKVSSVLGSHPGSGRGGDDTADGRTAGPDSDAVAAAERAMQELLVSSLSGAIIQHMCACLACSTAHDNVVRWYEHHDRRLVHSWLIQQQCAKHVADAAA